MSFADYDWSSVKILDVFSVTGHKAGTKLYSEGRTDIYQFGAKLTGKTEIIYNGKVIEYFAGSVLYLPKEKAHGVQYDKTFLENGKSICIFFDSEKPLPSEPVIIQNGCRFAGTAFTELCSIFGGNSKIGFKSASLFYEILDCLENATKNPMSCQMHLLKGRMNTSTRTSARNTSIFRHSPRFSILVQTVLGTNSRACAASLRKATATV